MLLGQLRKKVEAARQANRHEHHDQVPGDIHRGRVHETHRVGLQYSAELRPARSTPRVAESAKLDGCRSSGRGGTEANTVRARLAAYRPEQIFSPSKSIHVGQARPARSVAPARSAEPSWPSLPRHVRSERRRRRWRRRRWQRRTQRQQHLYAVPGLANQVLVSGCTGVGVR